jgi:outer membrane protein OmpA-like peptidoglycan-associated protein/tetratricopeptide (TPR) repeat protein
MKWNILLIFFSTAAFLCRGQENRSKGDNYFYAYEYQNAIEAYTKERSKNPLSDSQNLNLADAYFKMESYENASKLYLEVNKKDTTMSIHTFNKMLQSLSRTSNQERVIPFLRTKSTVLPSELIENSSFNYELLAGGEGNLDFDLFNVAINSPQADTSPAFYKNQLLFSSSRQQEDKNTYIPTGESYLDIYSAPIDENGMANNAVVFSKIPFSKFHKSTPFYSEKLNNIFYILSNTNEGEMAFDDNWKNALAIGVLNSSGQFRFLLKDLSTSFYYPFFDTESDRLYFAANFDDSYGGTDIYYVTTNNGQVMSAPTNLGPRINSPGNEISPFLFNGDLYFSSDVFYGLGGMDVYKSNITSNGGHSIPVNLGEGINTTKDDFGFIIKESGSDRYTGYLASNREGGKGGDDIYGFSINGIPGLKTFALRGKAFNSSSRAEVAQAQITVLNTKGAVIKETYSKADGSFSLEIPWQEGVSITASKEDHSIFSLSLTPDEMKEVQKSPFEIGFVLLDDLVEEKEGQKVIKLNKFYFDKGRSVVNAAIATELDKVIETVRKFPEIRLAIASHSDSRGSSSINLKLSQDRSNAIQSYLLKGGVSQATIIEALGYGEEKLANKCINGAYCLDFLHKQNERSLIKVMR